MTVEYAPGRLADVHGDAEAPTVLLWHGREPDRRSAFATLGERLAAAGARAVVPDWSADSADHGRGELLSSVRFARESAAHDPDRLILVGWSLGGTAAASLTAHQRRLGIGLARTVFLAGAFSATDPISHRPLDPPTAPKVETDLVFVHGEDDDLVPAEVSLEAQAAWAAAGWRTRLLELPVDHWSIVGLEKDGDAYRISDRPEVEAALDRIVDATLDPG